MRGDTFEFNCPLPHGLHARPAKRVVDCVEPFSSEVTLANLRSNATASARSVLALIALDLREGDRCRATVTGPDAAEAAARLRAFVEGELPRCDAALPAAKAAPGRPPRALRSELTRFHAGTPAAAGIGMGRIVHAKGSLSDALLPPEAPGDERERVAGAFRAVEADLRRRLDAAAGGVEADILGAHLAIARDGALRAEVDALVEGAAAAGGAVVEACSRLSSNLRRAGSAWIRERALDLEDVGMQLIEALGGRAPAIALLAPSVVVAETLTPRQLLSLERRHVAGLAIGHAGATSHAVILARSFGIPTLTGVAEARGLPSGTEAIVDAHEGVLIPAPSATVRRYYERAVRRAAPPTAAQGPTSVAIHANISTAEEVEAAIAAGADGIGLFRTEMMYMGIAPPGEEEQFLAYRRAAEAARGRPVVIRTLDVGGDKPLPYLDLPRETNPFLGVRGIRLYPRLRELVATQIRAIRRAAAHGDLRILLPMVSTVEEVRAFKGMFAGDLALPLGVMIEVPSAAFQIPELSQEVDFFSLGSNDLLQYFVAADRGNAAVASLYTPRSPPFLRLLEMVVADAHRHQRKVSLCGEMARDAAALPHLLRLGIDELSVNVPDLRPLRHAIACRGLLDPLLVHLGSGSESREEVLSGLALALQAAGRTDDAHAVEEALWAREGVATTAVGHGFAIPHCKCDAVAAHSVGFVRLATPVPWGDEAVQCVILLALGDSEGANAHLKVLARLARRLMHEEFRAALLAAPGPGDVLALLSPVVEERIPS